MDEAITVLCACEYVALRRAHLVAAILVNASLQNCCQWKQCFFLLFKITIYRYLRHLYNKVTAIHIGTECSQSCDKIGIQHRGYKRSMVTMVIAFLPHIKILLVNT